MQIKTTNYKPWQGLPLNRNTVSGVSIRKQEELLLRLKSSKAFMNMVKIVFYCSGTRGITKFIKSRNLRHIYENYSGLAKFLERIFQDCPEASKFNFISFLHNNLSLLFSEYKVRVEGRSIEFLTNEIVDLLLKLGIDMNDDKTMALDLRGLDLRGLNFDGLCLKFANLQGAKSDNVNIQKMIADQNLKEASYKSSLLSFAEQKKDSIVDVVPKELFVKIGVTLLDVLNKV